MNKHPKYFASMLKLMSIVHTDEPMQNALQQGTCCSNTDFR